VDKVVAARMEKELTGEELGGWKLAECIGHGKSALVFRASKGSLKGAVKVFDRELVEKFGKEAQRERVLREKSLVGKHHPNLIDILDAGEDAKRDLFFVVMALFPGKNLAEALAAVPYERVHDLIAQVASAAQFLEGLELAHRDIKPENIGVTDDFAAAVLLDLGVLRPVGFSTITDQHGQRSFVGTLQYSPPELLHREEQDSVDGWKAVSFYQLGGVLHDLLTRKPLFADDLTPYAHLVEVVSHTVVTIQAPGAAPELRMLAQDCLVKDPLQRLELVSWDRFQKRPAPSGDMHAVKDRIAQRRRSAAATAAAPSIAPGVVERRAVEELRNDIERILRDACKQSDLPPFTVQTDDSPIARLSLVFGPSRAHAVSATFAVYVHGTVVDAAAAIVHVNVGAALCSDPTALPPVAPLASSKQIFQGVRADDVLAQRLTDVLLLVLDTAQESCAQSRVTAAPEWIAIAGGM
jgi:eukaryotic-like serine/threonine-protein kinase